MEDRILFMVFNGEIKFLQHSSMDHKEWYLSLGGNMDEYDNMIRGFIMDSKIIFFKANLNYDKEVIDFATKMGLIMKTQLNHPEYKICCGINPGQDGAKWEPILTINEEDLAGYESEEEKQKREEKEKQKEQLEQAIQHTDSGPILEFKNDVESKEFIHYATIFTLILLGVAILAKVVLISQKTLMLSSRWNVILLLGQVASFVLTIVGYQKKMSKTKIFALAASIFSIILFDLVDVIIGVLNFLFTLDQNYIIKLMSLPKKIGEFIKKKRQKKM